AQRRQSAVSRQGGVRPGERSDPPDRGSEAPPLRAPGRGAARRQAPGEGDLPEGAADPDRADEELRSLGTAAGPRGGAPGMDAMARSLPLAPLAAGALAAVLALAVAPSNGAAGGPDGPVPSSTLVSYSFDDD